MKRKEAYILLLSTSVLIFAWVLFSILHSAISSTISENLNVQILPINPTFDVKTIEKLKKRVRVIPENTIDETPEASASSGVTPSPKSTGSASL
jgi:hypothetical protein